MSEIPRILALDPILSNQIAAGEVIERPASVIKELVENSLDAQATRIEIELEGAGMHLIRLRDNGVGIPKEDLGLAFMRHATSKIRALSDLSRVTSLGFRGEALASIASVSQSTLISCLQGQTQAWQIVVTPESLPVISPAAHPPGTSLEIAHLFYNTPVRRKFLRSEKTEFQAIEEVVKRLALANPEVSFSLKNQGKSVRYYPTVPSHANNLEGRIARVCGEAFMAQAVPVRLTCAGLAVQGWLGLPTLARRHADCQYFFINQRMVKDRLLNHVIKRVHEEQGISTQGCYPAYVLYLTIDPIEVDVNVHPTKQEVRFSEPRWVLDFLAKAVTETIQKTQQNIAHKIPEAMPEIIPEKIFERPSESIFEEIPQSIQPLIKRSGPRFVLVEDQEAVWVIDLVQGAPDIMAAYFEQYYDLMPVRTLLFPLRIKTEISFELLASLSAFGFELVPESGDYLLLRQPFAIKTTFDEQALKNLLKDLSTHKSLSAVLGKYFEKDLREMDPIQRQPLLHDWIRKSPTGAVVRISHADFTAGRVA